MKNKTYTRRELNTVTKSLETAKEIEQIMRDSNFEKEIDDFPNFKECATHNPHFSHLQDNLCDSTNYNVVKPDIKEVRRFRESMNYHRKRTLRLQISIAASAAAAVIALFLILPFNNKAPEIIHITDNVGYVKPVIILSNGESHCVKDVLNVDSESFNAKEPLRHLSPANKRDSIEYNTIIVPHHYFLKVVLSDGTTVNLNANSELKYPVKFDGVTREVILKGEAFFDVTKSQHPFIVHTNTASVKVYGTKFNINTNTNLNNIFETTLLSGSVGITANDHASKEVFITPNQRYIHDKSSNKTSVVDIDPEFALPWLDGYIACHDEPLRTLLEKLSGWYGVKFIVDSKNVDCDNRVTTSLSRDLKIEELLNIISSTLDIKISKIDDMTYRVEEGGEN